MNKHEVAETSMSGTNMTELLRILPSTNAAALLDKHAAGFSSTSHCPRPADGVAMGPGDR